MAFTIDARSVVKGGAVVGAIATVAAALSAAYSYAHPYIQNKPPYAEDAAFQIVAQVQAAQQRQIQQSIQNQLFLTQQFWVRALADAQEEPE